MAESVDGWIDEAINATRLRGGQTNNTLSPPKPYWRSAPSAHRPPATTGSWEISRKTARILQLKAATYCSEQTRKGAEEGAEGIWGG